MSALHIKLIVTYDSHNFQAKVNIISLHIQCSYQCINNNSPEYLEHIVEARIQEAL